VGNDSHSGRDTERILQWDDVEKIGPRNWADIKRDTEFIQESCSWQRISRLLGKITLKGFQMNCPICNTTNANDLVYHQGIYKCVACGHLFRNPTYNFDYSFYAKHDYWYKDPFWSTFQKTYFAFFEQWIITDPMTIELGAANGDFLRHVFDHLNSNLVGIFPDIYYNELKDIVSPPNESFIPKKNRLIGPMEDIDFYDSRFGNVFLIEVLEHFKYSKLSMSILEKITKKGGSINIFTEQSFDTFITAFKFKELFFWTSPVGKAYTVLEKI